ncbi:hypothetical protein MNEG_15902 [Monoraphidium neglectum]|jgi:hypothetical protein|uniref:Uncharacterized protein n=1 Tax=Monoraphidium neglectum TaxID=145388 RepID=A0A0D2IVW5_9CHLO|nr:hypothetical protein MNEG_15902 [Monoraphidium neglectum]KIY92062.1 hypothetical protein MNEG_15902 [Monoraphidium neglectum]|eukprot:XP_013891082.1 hypothetical protein MNEG_15902 [Monoraphidium neglectum]
MHLCAVVAPTQDVAFMYSIAWTAVQLLFNNFFITFREVTLGWLTNLRFVSAVYFAYEGIATVEFAGVRMACSAGVDANGIAFLKELLPNSRLLDMHAVQAALAAPGPDCVTEAGAVLDFFTFNRGFSATLAILVGYWLVTHVLTYLALLLVARKERR